MKTPQFATAILLGALVLAVAPATQASQPCIPSRTAFMIDVSGSMMLEQPDAVKADGTKDDTPKIVKAKALAGKLAADSAGIPSAVVTMGPFTERAPYGQRSARETQAIIEAIPDDLETVGRMTWIGERAKNFLTGTPGGPRTLVLLTDGGFTKWKEEEKVLAKKAFDAFRAGKDNKLIIISYAGDDEEKERLQEVLGEGAIDGNAVVADEVQYKAVTEVLNSDACAPVQTIELQGIVFEYDKAVITAQSRQILDEALKVIRTRSENEPLAIVGWTDSSGSDAYNRKLSWRRAEAVRQYFASKGIAPERMSVIGKGKSYKYDNATAEGRLKNRRVDIEFGNGK